MEIIYCAIGGKMFSILNKFLQEFLFPQTVITLITPKENKIVSDVSQTQQYICIFIFSCLDNIFRLMHHHQAILNKTQNPYSEFCKGCPDDGQST